MWLTSSVTNKSPNLVTLLTSDVIETAECNKMNKKDLQRHVPHVRKDSLKSS